MSNIKKAFEWATTSDWCTLPNTELSGTCSHKSIIVVLFILMSPVYILLLLAVIWLALVGDAYNVAYHIATVKKSDK